jgi:predicted dehydrogenase
VRLYAEGDTHDTQVEVEDNISVVTRYSNGALGSVDAMSCARGQAPGGNRLFGTLGQLDMTRGCRLFTRRTDLPGIQPNAWAELRPAKAAHRGDSRATFFSRFAQAVLSGAPKGPIPGEEGRQVLAFCVAAYESARRHQVVEFRPGTWEPIL